MTMRGLMGGNCGRGAFRRFQACVPPRPSSSFAPPTLFGGRWSSDAPRPPTAADAESTYAPWEIRALLLPLLPMDGAAVGVREVAPLLPRAARDAMARAGSPLAYIQTHLSAEIEVRGTALARRAASRGAERDVLPAVPLPPPPSAPRPPPPGARTTLELLDALVAFIPTFFVPQQAVAEQLPGELARHYAGSTFLHFVKRFRHYVDIRAQHGQTEIRLRPDLAHARRGEADARYAAGRSGGDGASQLARGRRPPRHSEANLIHFLLPRMPTAFTALAAVLREVSDIVARHPSFDPRLGVTGLFEKYPEYFQIVDARLRVRPFRSAPNSLDDRRLATSPLPEVYAKVKARVDAQAEGKDYGVASQRAAAAVATGQLYAELSAAERDAVRACCRSFPRFLRLHGAELVVAVDNARVWQFRPSYERCAETVMDERLAACALSPDDAVLKVPAAMDEHSAADWAVRELYDALPLLQCAELDEVVSLVPPAVRRALPEETTRLVEHLALFPDYFATWPFPDDAEVVVVQRAKLEVPEMTREDVARMVLPLVPQGGIEAGKLIRRVPLPLQRYFYRHGLKMVLREMEKYFLVVGDKIIRVG